MDTSADSRSYPDTFARRVFGENSEAGTMWMVLWALLFIIIVGGVFSALFAIR